MHRVLFDLTTDTGSSGDTGGPATGLLAGIAYVPGSSPLPASTIFTLSTDVGVVLADWPTAGGATGWFRVPKIEVRDTGGNATSETSFMPLHSERLRAKVTKAAATDTGNLSGKFLVYFG